MKAIQDLGLPKKERPIKVVQFGEGNFLRAFADYMIDVANEAGAFHGNIAIIKPIQAGSLEKFREQSCLYTVLLRGREENRVVNQRRIVTSVEKALCCYEDYEEYLSLAELDTLEFIISNTTEAGIVLDEGDCFEEIPRSYPGKLTQFLYHRYQAFGGAPEKGLVILPVELIEDNGEKLKECVVRLSELWGLPEEFLQWIQENNIFCSTLVDRIVTGFPKTGPEKEWEALGYKDELLDIAEPFGLWVIQSQTDISQKFPLPDAGLPVVFTQDLRPYRERKVRILNGAHTSTVLLGWLCGLSIVRDCMHDPIVSAFMKKAVLEELAPEVSLPEKEVSAFARAVFQRFDNPFIDHQVLDISLNSISKWKSRILPSFRDHYRRTGQIPPALAFSFAGLLAFYTVSSFDGAVFTAVREDGTAYAVRDDLPVLEFFAEHSREPIPAYVTSVISNPSLWGEDLSLYPGFYDAVLFDLTQIRALGAREALTRFLRG